jgi:hypothetical protein
VASLEVSGGGSAQFRAKGADNSIANYGSEAPQGELREAAEAVHGYFAGLATENWAGACTRLSRKVAASTKRLAASLPGFKGGCPAALAALYEGASSAEGREATTVDAVSLRQQGGRGFLIYRGSKGKPYFASVAREGGNWVVSGLGPSPLP